MKTRSTQTRRALSCGFETPDDGAPTWLPPGAGSRLGFGGERQDGDYKLSTCPGFTTSMPAVVDVVRARAQWEKGELRSYCSGAPTEQMLIAIEVLDNACARHERWARTDEKDGGGRRSDP